MYAAVIGNVLFLWMFSMLSLLTEVYFREIWILLISSGVARGAEGAHRPWRQS